MRLKRVYGIAEGVNVKRDIVRISGLFINLSYGFAGATKNRTSNALII
jgi:hypothetical protein